MRPALPVLALALTSTLAARGAFAEEAPPRIPPSPYAVLGSRLLETPPIDPFPLCVPGDIEHPLGAADEYVRPGDIGEALERLAPMAEGEHPIPDLQTFVATLRARLADDDDARHAARREIIEVLPGTERAGVRRCALLESARLELALGLLPEAGASVVRAMRGAGDDSAAEALRERANFYRAEALYLAHHFDDSEVLYRALRESETGSVKEAAWLRRADLEMEAGRTAPALERYRELLRDSGRFGAPPAPWAPRAAEAAIHEGDLEAADRWISAAYAAEDDPQDAAVLAIRKADVRFAKGDEDTARRLLETVVRKRAGTPAGDLAEVRMIVFRFGGGGPPDWLESLRSIEGRGDRGVATYARSVLARLQLQGQDLEGAFETLSTLSYESPQAELAPELGEDVDALLRAAAADAAGDAACPELVRRLGGRRDLLLRHAKSPEPFLRLGECYVENGMPGTALEVYRGIANHFQGHMAERVALHMARATLETGDVATARAAATARIEVPGPKGDPWRLLLAEVDLREGRAREAAERLEPLVAEARPETDRERAVVALARAARGYPASDSTRATLAKALQDLPDPGDDRARELLGEAALHAGELHRDAGDASRAHTYYGMALERLPDGTMRAQAAYWTGSLSDDPHAAREAWEASAAIENGGVWSRMARNELRLAALRSEIGRGHRPPRAEEPAATPAEQSP